MCAFAGYDGLETVWCSTVKYSKLQPNFLGIGAGRAGITWLSENLREHPDIWMTPLKELCYFDRSTAYPSPSFLASDKLLSRVLGRGYHNRQSRSLLVKRFRANLRCPNWRRIKWDLRFLFGTYNDEWYASLFREGKGKVRGEITPSYSTLNSQDVRHIRNMMPGLKLIYILRNPIDRTWSHARRLARLQTRRGDLTSGVTVWKFVDAPGMALWADCVRTITTWLDHFPEKQFFIAYFDEIAQRPKTLLLKCFEFLDVEASETYITTKAFCRYNALRHEEIPADLKLYLSRKYYHQMKELSTMFGGYTTSWMQEAERTLEAG